MIIYDLRCDKGHTFEGWFKDRSSFEQQCEAQLINCPVCGSSHAEMVPSSIAVLGKDTKAAEKNQTKEISPLTALRMIHEYIDKHFDDVGNRFAEVALKIHHGEEDKRGIKGTTSSEEEEVLKEEGIPFVKIPMIKYDG